MIDKANPYQKMLDESTWDGDPRYDAFCAEMRKLHPGNVAKLYKTTSAGVSSAFIRYAVENNLRALLVGPTTRLLENLLDIGVRISDHPDRYNIHTYVIQKNAECPVIKEEIEQCKPLALLTSHLLPDCRECGMFGKCVITLPIVDATAHIYGITSTKLGVLLLASEKSVEKNEPSISVQLLDKITDVDIIMFDESHLIFEEPKRVTSVLYDIDKDTYMAPIGKLPNIIGNEMFPILNRYVIGNLCKLMSNPKVLEAVDRIKNAVVDGNKMTHVNCERVYNRHHIDMDERIGKERHSIFVLINKEFHDAIKYLNSMGKEYLDEIMDLVDLYKNMALVCSPYINLHGNITGYSDNIHREVVITVIDYAFIETMNSFVRHGIKSTAITLFTTATFGSYDYGKLFGNDTEVQNLVIGPGGDPAHTCDNQLIICNDRKLPAYGDNSQLGINTIQQLADLITAFPDAHIITMSGTISRMVRKALMNIGIDRKKQIDYYGSVDSIGVRSDTNVMIMLNAAHIPIHACDAIAMDNGYGIEADSLRIRREHIDAAVNQAAGRCKAGSKRNVLFMIGFTEKEVINQFTWGPGKQTKPVVDEEGKVIRNRFSITVDRPLACPLIVSNTDTNEMIDIARRFVDIVSPDGAHMSPDGVEKQILRTGYTGIKSIHDWKRVRDSHYCQNSLNSQSNDYSISEEEFGDFLMGYKVGSENNVYIIVREVKNTTTEIPIQSTACDKTVGLQFYNVYDDSEYENIEIDTCSLDAEITQDCTEDFCEGTHAPKHIHINAERKKVNVSLLDNIINGSRYMGNGMCVNDPVEFIRSLCFTTDFYAEHARNGLNFIARKDGMVGGKILGLTTRAIMDHLSGQRSYATPHCTDEMLTHIMTINIPFNEVNRSYSCQHALQLIRLLVRLEIPHNVFRSASGYQIMFSLLPVPAYFARAFGISLLKEIGFCGEYHLSGDTNNVTVAPGAIKADVTNGINSRPSGIALGDVIVFPLGKDMSTGIRSQVYDRTLDAWVWYDTKTMSWMTDEGVSLPYYQGIRICPIVLGLAHKVDISKEICSI